jgi:uncharacterized metal-binding protein YceD (DUF177 family)
MIEPEFSRIIEIRQIDDNPLTLAATPEECAALATRFALVAVHSLSATLRLSRDGRAVLAKGRIQAQIVQSCAISAEDLPATIDEALNLRFQPETEDAASDEVELTEDDCDQIAYSGERIDLGEAIAQSMILAVDPFAEGPNADKIRKQVGLLGEEALNPFAALAHLQTTK